MFHVLIALFCVSVLVFSGLILPIASAQSVISILSPLKQFDTGTPVHEVKCKQGFILIIRGADNSPACIKPESANKLMNAGWGIIANYTKPKLSQNQAFQIVKGNLLKHVPSLNRILSYGDSSPSPTFQKYPIRLFYESSSGIQFGINNTNYSVEGKCDTKKEYCPIPGEYRIQLMKGKLVYYANVDAYSNNHYLPVNYLVDAIDGEIIYSDLSMYIEELNRTGDYIP